MHLGKGRKAVTEWSARRFVYLAPTLLATMASTSAQSWSAPFNHETVTTSTTATDHRDPFKGPGGSTAGITYWSIYGYTFDWAQRMNAAHMCLIPKGEHQGKVLVWGAVASGAPDGVPGSAVLVRYPSGSGPVALSPGEYWACTAWSIVDPDPEPTGPKFRNYLLPIQRWTVSFFSGGLLPDYRFPSLFCAGHAWSPFGDLIVAGGTFYNGTIVGANFALAFNPRLETDRWPGIPATTAVYPGQLGLWKPASVVLQEDRFYPTVTLTARLNRLGSATQPPREVAFIAGGTRKDYLPDDPVENRTWNSYEALVVSEEADAIDARLSTDQVGGQALWPGPGSPLTAPPYPEVEEDWLGAYPRFTLMSTGRLFFSGYAPRWAHVDHDGNPGVWTRQAAPAYSSTTWQLPRHDGMCVLFPNVAGEVDRVLRIGGSDEGVYAPPPNGTTATTEVFRPDGLGGDWSDTGDLPNEEPNAPAGRYLANLVILPDASLLLVGGLAKGPGGNPTVATNAPLLFKDGAWSELPPNPCAGFPAGTTSPRDYHSTAVLLPDGRVMIGGGNGRNFDYEVFSPAYLANTAARPENVHFDPPVPYSAPQNVHELGYDQSCSVLCDSLPLGVAVTKAVLMAPGACTHHFDMHQRYVEMATTNQRPEYVDIVTPAHDKLAPRGYYMLFLVTNAGTVSRAIWVRLS